MAVMVEKDPSVAQAICLSAVVGSGCGPTAYVKIRTSEVTSLRDRRFSFIRIYKSPTIVHIISCSLNFTNLDELLYLATTSAGKAVPPSLNKNINLWHSAPSCNNKFEFRAHISKSAQSAHCPYGQTNNANLRLLLALEALELLVGELERLPVVGDLVVGEGVDAVEQETLVPFGDSELSLVCLSVVSRQIL